MEPIKVLIIDDSALTRSMLQTIIKADPMLHVVGTAMDPIIAARKIQQLNPDVITLDLEMPRMGGLAFLKKLMINSPKPVIVISGNSAKDSKNAIHALELGALDVIEKPDLSTPEKISAVSTVICMAIKAAASAKISARKTRPISKESLSSSIANKIDFSSKLSTQIIVIGASTGGPGLLQEIFQSIHSNIPGCVVVQHMPGSFTKSFADRLNSLSGLTIKEASTGDYVRNNQVLIIPGEYHGVLKKDSQGYYILLNQEEKVNRHRPSVDVLFCSAAEVAGGKATGILLTGMGDDGARGLFSLRKSGATTIAQDALSCVVFGMPKRAIEMDAAQEVLSTEQIITRINEFKLP